MGAVPCKQSEADWYVEVWWGKTQCEEHGSKCRREACEREYGTYTDCREGYFRGDRPTLAERDAMMPPGAYRLKSKVKRCTFRVNVEYRSNGVVCVAVTGPSDAKSLRSARHVAAARARQVAEASGGTATFISGGSTVGPESTETRRIYAIN